jgi:hypothetical protein
MPGLMYMAGGVWKAGEFVKAFTVASHARFPLKTGKFACKRLIPVT